MRPFVASCAATISNICVHPLDTIYIQKQLQKNQIENVWAGVLESAISSFFATGFYFSIYEYCFEKITGIYKIPISTFLGTSFSAIVSTPLSVSKKRAQVNTNYSNLSQLKWFQLYLLNIGNKFPRSVLKYSMYEPLLVLCKSFYSNLISGFISSLVASLLAAIVFEPIELTRTYQSLGLSTNYSNIYNGLRYGVFSSISQNVIGHTILEIVAPR